MFNEANFLEVSNLVPLTDDDSKVFDHYFIYYFERNNALGSNKLSAGRLLLKEFQHLLDLFPTCATSLLPIHRLYLELTSKEQSKRQRILDIMQTSLITLESTTSKDSKFNFHLHLQEIIFADMSELRDRACVIENSNDYQLQNRTQLEMEQILETMSALFLAEHHQLTDDNVKYEFACINGEFDKLEQLCTQLEDELKV